MMISRGRLPWTVVNWVLGHRKKKKEHIGFSHVLGFQTAIHFALWKPWVLLPASASKRQPNSPNSCLFPFYHYPQSRGITCLLDMKHSFFGLSQAKHEGHHHYLAFQIIISVAHPRHRSRQLGTYCKCLCVVSIEVCLVRLRICVYVCYVCL